MDRTQVDTFFPDGLVSATMGEVSARTPNLGKMGPIRGEVEAASTVEGQLVVAT
jgi:hypothetical protein